MGKKIICGHTPQRSGKIPDVGFAAYIDAGSASGGEARAGCIDVKGSGAGAQTAALVRSGGNYGSAFAKICAAQALLASI
jgi:hypothetical protein